MRTLFSYNNPLALGLMLAFSVALRLPSFHPNYFSTDESFYIVAAERMVDGGVQYADTWDNKPPVIGWFYALFVWLFGNGGLMAIRIFTCLYLFVCALLICRITSHNRLLENFGLLPGFIFLLLCAVPWYAQELNAEMLLLLPVIVALFQIYNVAEHDPRNHSRLLLAGLMLGLAFMIKYQAVFLLFTFLIGHTIVNPPRFSEYFSMFSGFVLAIFSVVLTVYFTGALPAFWDIGILYNLDYISIGKNPGEETNLFFNLQQYGKLWGAVVFAGLGGMVYLRLNYFTQAIRIRRLEALLFFWFIGAMLALLPGLGRLYLHYFILAAAPIAVYAAVFFELIRRLWLRLLLSLACLAGPAYTYGVFLSAAFPESFQFADEWFEPMDWVNGLRQTLNEPPAIASKIDKSRVKNGVLVLDDDPELYLRLGVPCATKYTNFSIAYYKIPFFPHNQNRELFSQEESAPAVYRAFRDDLPEYIIDPLNLFPSLRENIPVLFSGYSVDSLDGIRIYSRL